MSESNIYIVFKIQHQYNYFCFKMILKVNYNKKTHLINTQDKPNIDDLKKTIAKTFKSLPDRYALSYVDEDGDQITLQNQQDYQILLSSIQKAVKINVKEVNQEFVEFTEKIDIQEKIDEIKDSIKEVEPLPCKIGQVQKNMESNISELDESIIQEKLKRMMPDIVSKIKSQISQQLTQRSRLSDQPLVIQDIVQPQQAQKQLSKDKMSEPSIKAKKTLVVHEGVTCDNCQKRNITGVRYKCSVCNDYDFCQECQANVQHPHPFLKIKRPKQAPVKIFTVIDAQEEKLELNGQYFNPQGSQNLLNLGFDVISNIFEQTNARSRRSQKIDIPSGCPFKNACKKTKNQTEVKPQKTEVQKKETVETEVSKPKVEEKIEPKKQSVPVKVQSKEKPVLKVDEQKFVANARYLASFGFQFGKCYQWARTYPGLSKEQLLQLCLNQAEFLN